MKKEQIELMTKLQEAIEKREKLCKILIEMKEDVSKGTSFSYFPIKVYNEFNITTVSNRDEMKEQIEFLLAYHQVKLNEQKTEMESYILSKTE